MDMTRFVATYNCSDSFNQSYGAGNYSTCDGSVVGVPNTGLPAEYGGVLGIILPLAAVVILIAVSTMVVRFKRSKQRS